MTPKIVKWTPITKYKFYQRKMSAQNLDMTLLGTGWMNVFGEEMVPKLGSKNLDNLFPNKNGIHVKGTITGIEFPEAKLGKAAAAMIEENSSCVLFVADNFHKEYLQFVKLSQTFKGYIILIVLEETDSARWERVEIPKERVYRYFQPKDFADAQTFIGNCVSQILLIETLKMGQLVY